MVYEIKRIKLAYDEEYDRSEESTYLPPNWEPFAIDAAIDKQTGQPIYVVWVRKIVVAKTPPPRQHDTQL